MMKEMILFETNLFNNRILEAGLQVSNIKVTDTFIKQIKVMTPIEQAGNVKII